MSQIEARGQWSGPGATALARLAPGPAEALAELAGTTAGLGETGLVGLARAVCAETLGLVALPNPSPAPSPASVSVPAPTLALADPAAHAVAAEFAEQFSLDVSAITPAARAALAAELGSGAREFVMAVYIADWVPRVRRGLDELFDADPAAADPADPTGPADPVDAGWPVPPAVPSPSLWPAIDALLVSVARLSAVDPVTTELVRLRGARQHNCQMCKSLRSVPALRAGADESMFDAVDDYADSALPPRQKAALALADALIWQPAHLPADVLEEVRRQFTPAEAVELVLDVARNATNKIAVSLGSDAAAVEDGVQTYEVRADGSIDYDATFDPLEVSS